MGLVSKAEWDYLLEDPIARVKSPGVTSGCGGCENARQMPPDSATGIDPLFDWVKNHPRDLDQHAEKIRELASRVDHVTAFVKRRE